MIREIGGVWRTARQSPRKDLVLCAVASVGIGLMLALIARWLFSGASAGGLDAIEREQDWGRPGHGAIAYRTELALAGVVGAFLSGCAGLLGLICALAAALPRDAAEE